MRFAILSVIALCLAVLAAALAQQEPDKKKTRSITETLGSILDLTACQYSTLNMFGVGDALGTSRHFDVAYWRGRSAEPRVGGSGPNVRMLHFCWPKIQTTGPLRFFALLRAVCKFWCWRPVTAGAINAQIGSITDGNYRQGVFIPGGGIEFNRGNGAFARRRGRNESGSMTGVHHSLRVAFGPQSGSKGRHQDGIAIAPEDLLDYHRIMAVLVLSACVVAVANDSPEFAKFKREMMPKVGQKITVVGTLRVGQQGF